MLLFNPVSERQVKKLVSNLPQGILLSGMNGVGLKTIALYMAGTDLSGIIEPLDKDENPNHIKGTIGVKRIRELYDQSRSKSLTRQVFIIDDCEKMSPGAANAFLKLLEEPNPTVHFILTTHYADGILPTIKSRIEQVNILPLDVEQSRQLLARLHVQADKHQQMLFIANGLPSEIARMASDDGYFAAKADTMAAAKTLLSGRKADQLQVIFSYASDREKSLQLLQAMIMIVRFMLKTKSNADSVNQLQRLSDAYDAIMANGNTKLQLIAAVV